LPTCSVATPVTAAPAPPTPTATPHPTLPGYEILGVLGRGGMGIVYRARQVKAKRLVAVKMILARSGAAEPERARFRTEAEAVARLQHPNIVQIFEVGEHDGLPFFSLEFVEGGTLAAKLAGTPLPPRQAATLSAALAHAMHAAHTAGVIHRDLKPANVLLTPDGTPKVTDFGLAKSLDEDSGQTHEGMVMGTPAYMAPEQARGAVKEFGPPTDVYALGAILYECLTGRPPFQGASTLETLEQVRGREPVPPRHLQPTVPGDLETICLKCLHKEPARRYATAADLAEDLGHFLAGEPIKAKAVGPLERALKWARRRPAYAALAVAVVVALVSSAAGAVFYGLYLRQQASALRQQLDRRQRVDHLWNQAQQAENAKEYTDAKGYLDTALATLQDDPGAHEELRQRIEESRARVEQQLDARAARERLLALEKQFAAHKGEVLRHEISVAEGDRAADRAAIRREAPAALALFGLTGGGDPAVPQDEALATASRALEPYRRQFESPQEMAQVAADCYQVLLVWAEAETAAEPAEVAPAAQTRLRRALRRLDVAAALGKAYHLPDPQAFHLRRARVLSLLGDRAGERAERDLAATIEPATALDLFLTALDRVQTQPARAALECAKALQQDPNHFWAQYLQAVCYLKTRQWADASAGLTICLNRDPNFAWARSLRAVALGWLGKFEEAGADFKEVLAQTTDPLARAVALNNRGVLWVQLGRWDDAVSDLGEAIRLQPAVPEWYVNLARAHEGRKDPDAAVKALDAALTLRADAAWYHTRAQANVSRRNFKAAREDFDQAIKAKKAGKEVEAAVKASACVELAHLQHLAGEQQAALDSCAEAEKFVPDYLPAYRQRAEALLALNRHADAGKALDRYLLLAKKTEPDLDKVYLARGLIHARLGQPDRAVEAYSRALALRLDADTLSYRGWAYLQLDAARPALSDFDLALQLLDASRPGLMNFEELRKGALVRGDVLGGRGQARVRLGQVQQAVADTEQALKQDRPGRRLLFSAACIYARAVGQVEASGGRLVTPATVSQYRARALKLLQDALDDVPAAERKAYWRDNVRREPALDPLRSSAAFAALARDYAL
jgi:tetratricopeptide (TPR) repeat protein